MEDYILEEVPANENTPKGEKRFATPSGRQYRVKVQAASYGPNILIMDDNDRIVTSSGLGFSGGDEASAREIVERQIASLIRSAESQDVAREEAYNYFATEWGVDMNNVPAEHVSPPKVKLLRNEEG